MKKKAFTLVETMVAVGIFSFIFVGIMSMFGAGLQFYSQTNTDVDITNEASSSMRDITKTLRSAVSITILNNGATLVYNLPKYSSYVDPVTGEKEIVDPVTSDGVDRMFSVTNGQLLDNSNSKVLVHDMTLTDPDPKSSQYNQVYAPFQLTTIGSRRALTVTLITKKYAGGTYRYTRMKDTVILRNSQ